VLDGDASVEVDDKASARQRTVELADRLGAPGTSRWR
jgi:hypothetical protein